MESESAFARMHGRILATTLSFRRKAQRAEADRDCQAHDAATGKVMAEARHLTADLGGKASTTEMGDAIAAAV